MCGLLDLATQGQPVEVGQLVVEQDDVGVGPVQQRRRAQRPTRRSRPARVPAPWRVRPSGRAVRRGGRRRWRRESLLRAPRVGGRGKGPPAARGTGATGGRRIALEQHDQGDDDHRDHDRCGRGRAGSAAIRKRSRHARRRLVAEVALERRVDVSTGLGGTAMAIAPFRGDGTPSTLAVMAARDHGDRRPSSGLDEAVPDRPAGQLDAIAHDRACRGCSRGGARPSAG